MPSLLVKEGPLAGRLVEVEDELVLGREDADMTLDDPQVSRRHAVIRRLDGELEIEDLGSLNGTWVNGERVAGRRRLAPGDVVTVGGSAIVVREVRRRSATTMARPGVTRAAANVEAPGPEWTALRAEEDELRPVTALFADIVGSTALGERLAPHEVKALIGECVTRMSHAVEQFGGTVQAYMGDGIAAFFGMPHAHEDDPERAALAALRILRIISEYGREVEEAWGIAEFDVRIGINSGPAAVGMVGAADPQEVSVGDTTNVAARLQSSAEPGTVAVGEATARRLADRFMLDPLGDLAVKGRAVPVRAWRLLQPRTVPSGDSAPTPLVGREAEVARISTAVDDLKAGRGQVLFLLGDAGIGKTRLLAELRRIAAEDATWLEGECLSYGAELLFWPFVEILRGWLGVEDADSDVAVRTKLRANLAVIGSSRASEILPSLARLLSLRLDPELAEPLGKEAPDDAGSRTRRAYCGWVEAISQQRPVVLAIEDLHWADRSTRELAEDLLEVVERSPLLLAITSRVDPDSEGWRLRVRASADYPHRVVDLAVPPLSDSEANELLDVLGGGRLDEVERRQIAMRAEGNPLYLEELFEAFTDADQPRRDETRGLTLTSALAVPLALEGLLVARIDRLPEGARRLAQVAAVIGRSFRVRVLEHVSGSEHLNEDLMALLRADVIREMRRYPEREYAFRHGLLQEAAIATLTPLRRRRLFDEVGTAFEALCAASLDEHLELLAHYFARGQDLPKALDYLERAAERAAALDAPAQAERLWRRAAKVATRLGEEETERRIADRLASLENAAG